MGKRQEAAKETRRKLMAAAAELGSERGYDELTVEMVTERAGVAKGTFYTHFKRREDIISEVAFESFSDLAERLRAKSKDPVEAVSRFLIESVELIESQGLATAQQWMSGAMQPTGETAPGTRKFRFDMNYLSERVRRIVPRLEEQEIEFLCEEITAQYYGIVALWCLTDGKTDMQRAMRDYCRSPLKNLLRFAGEDKEHE